MEWKHDCDSCRKQIDNPADAVLAAYPHFPGFGAAYCHASCFASGYAKMGGPNAAEALGGLGASPEKLQGYIAGRKFKFMMLTGVVCGAIPLVVFAAGAWPRLDLLQLLGMGVFALIAIANFILLALFLSELNRFRRIRSGWRTAAQRAGGK